MMKKLLFLIGLLAAATLPAVDLLDFCPSAADGALRIDVEKILKHHVPARLNLQLHKFIWGADAEGV